jgi:hypothetical protein
MSLGKYTIYFILLFFRYTHFQHQIYGLLYKKNQKNLNPTENYKIIHILIYVFNNFELIKIVSNNTEIFKAL